MAQNNDDFTDRGIGPALEARDRQIKLLGLAESLANLGHYRIDTRTQQVEWSEEMYRIHGVDPADDRPLDIERTMQLVVESDRARVGQMFRNLLDHGEMSKQQFGIVRPDNGEHRFVNTKATLERDDDGAPVAIFGVVTDVTNEVELNARLARSERLVAVGQLARGVAHEVNNPLAVIQTNLHWMRETLERVHPDEIRDAIAETLEATQRITQIIGSLTALSSSSIRRISFFQLHEVVERALETSETKPPANVTLDVDVASDLKIPAIAGKMEQVVDAIITNAVQACADGTPHRVRIEGTAEHGLAVLRIIDDGAGIPEANLSRVFDPFFSTRQVGVGTGLGLSTSHAIVTSLDGTIDIKSEVGRGTVVTIRLPVIKPEARPTLDPPRVKFVPERGRVLIVDDEPAVAQAIQRALRSEHDVFVAHSGQDALDLIEEEVVFDVILCDIRMPGMSGTDLYRVLENRRPPLARRFVFLTGGIFEDEILDFLESTRCPRVDKPFEIQELRDLVRKLL